MVRAVVVVVGRRVPQIRRLSDLLVMGRALSSIMLFATTYFFLIAALQGAMHLALQTHEYYGRLSYPHGLISQLQEMFVATFVCPTPVDTLRSSCASLQYVQGSRLLMRVA